MERVNEKIPEWNKSQPEWWNAQKIAIISDWAVQNPEVLRSIRSEDVVKVVEKRRGSMRGSIRGSILNVAGTGELENQTLSDPGALRRRSIKAKAKLLERGR